LPPLFSSMSSGKVCCLSKRNIKILASSRDSCVPCIWAPLGQPVFGDRFSKNSACLSWRRSASNSCPGSPGAAVIFWALLAPLRGNHAASSRAEQSRGQELPEEDCLWPFWQSRVAPKIEGEKQQMAAYKICSQFTTHLCNSNSPTKSTFLPLLLSLSLSLSQPTCISFSPNGH